MTVPLIPARHGAASPTPRAFDPESVSDWINVLHHANAVQPDAPDYAEARQVAAQAWARIGHLQRKAGAADREAQNFQPVNPVVSGLAGAAHGLTMGIGEPLSGLGSAMTGGSFREGATRYREGLERLAMSNPATFAASEFGSQIGSMFVPIKAAVGPITARVPLTLADKSLRVARGAATGAGIGAVGGFSAGGEDPGSFEQRFDAAKTGAGVGAALGGVTTGLGLRFGRRNVEAEADLAHKGVVDATAEANLQYARLRNQRLEQRMGAQPGPVTDQSLRTQKPGYATTDPPTQDLPEYTPPTRQGPYQASSDLPGRPAKPIDWAAIADEMRPPPDAPPPAAPATVPPRPPTPNPSSSTPEPVYPAPQGPPSPPKAPEGWGEPTEAMLRTRRDVVRQGADPTKSYQELYGDVVPPPQSQPNPILDEAVQAPKVVETSLRPARKVPAGPYQKAAPATRMESAPPNVVAEAIKLSDQHPELLKYIPTEDLQSYRLGAVLTADKDAAPELLRAQAARLTAIDAELASRAGAGDRGVLPAGEPMTGDVPFSLRSIMGDKSGRLGPLYHGSPHKFDKFDLSKIGTGEGAQAYGHGLYFAENPNVAKSYQTNLTDGKVRILVAGKDVTPVMDLTANPKVPLSKRGQDMALAWVETNAGASDPIGNAMNAVQRIIADQKSAPEYRALAHEAMKTLDEWKASGATIHKPGALYTAELPDAHPDEFLDWDKPLSEQSPKVQEAVGRILGDATSPEIRDGMKLVGGGVLRVEQPDPDFAPKYFIEHGSSKMRLSLSDVKNLIGREDEGKAIYSSLADKLGSQQDATRQLRAVGIRGIRYLDGGSRRAGEGSHNYVVFNDADINILHREGNTGLKMLLGMTGAGAAAAAAPKLLRRRDR